jgi:hypothetical protein
MAYQGFTNEEGKLDVLLELTGQVINRVTDLFPSKLQDAIHLLQHITLTLLVCIAVSLMYPCNKIVCFVIFAVNL